MLSDAHAIVSGCHLHGFVHCLSSRSVEHGAAVTVAHSLGEPSRGNRVARSVFVDRGAGQQSVEIVGELLRFPESSLAAFGVAGHVGVLDGLAVVMRCNGLGDERDDMIAAPTKVLL